MLKRIAPMGVAILLSACSNLLSQKAAELAPTTQPSSKGETVTLPAQLRTLTIKSGTASFLNCAEPGPDVALSDTFKLVTGITSERAANASDAASASSSTSLSNELQTATTALELAGRTQTVLLAREFLYRTCEAASNGWLTPADVKDAHHGTLEQITGMVAADKKKAETAGVLAVVAAGASLDAKSLANASTAVRAAIENACTTDFESCIGKAPDDKAKAQCRAALKLCLN